MRRTRSAGVRVLLQACGFYVTGERGFRGCNEPIVEGGERCAADERLRIAPAVETDGNGYGGGMPR
jgi:hypothetical protein